MKKILISVFVLCLIASQIEAQTKDYGAYDSLIGEAVQGLGKKYALVIGVDYAGADRLEWTVDDAVEIGWLLDERFGFDVTCAITRYPLDEARNEKAEALNAMVGKQYTDQTGILNLFDQLIKRVTNTNDQVLIYFSGHGKPDPFSEEVGYLIPTGGDLDNPSTTLVEMRRFVNLSKRLRARHAMFVVDSCFSGIAGAFSKMASFDAVKSANSHEVKRLMGSRARQIMTAGNTLDEAKMLPEKKMSAFSYFFKRALEIESGYLRADLSRDGVVRVSELQIYLSEKLKLLYEQHPRLFNYTENDGEYVFVPKDFENWTKEKKEGQGEVIIIPSVTVGPSESGITEDLPEERELKGTGGLFISAEPDGVIALITAPNGTQYKGSCPITKKDLPAGQYILELSKPLFHTERIPIDIGIRIERKSVVLQPNFGWLTIKSEPSGAAVYLGDQYVSKTPVNEKVKQSGTYSLSVEMPNYHTHTSKITISDELTETIDVKLKPAFGTLIVDSEPEGAEVWIDGESYGNTNIQNTLSSGTYIMSLEKEFYLPVLDQQIIIRDRETTEKKYVLKPNFGTLTLTSIPSGADVYVSKIKKGSTPVAISLIPGRHRISIDKDESEWIPKQYNVTIVKDASIELAAELRRKKGGLNIYVEPMTDKAQIYLNNDETPRGIAPMTILDLGTGEYKVICRTRTNDRTLAGEVEVVVEWGMVKNITVAMKEVGARYRLRDDAIRISDKNARKIFKLDEKWRPLEYVKNDYVFRGDGTITDKATGLMWQQSGSDRWQTYNQAKAYIQKLNREKFADYNDWRLPTVPELMSLLEPKKNLDGLYISTVFDVKPKWCWSADTQPSKLGWLVSFNTGKVGWMNRGNYFARAVRSGQ